MNKKVLRGNFEKIVRGKRKEFTEKEIKNKERIQKRKEINKRKENGITNKYAYNF